ncbi:MAG TPA: hypothetical protein VN905_08225 [Candidatus Binatia bacterium]|nr:hypothetical protein [Candidatus Binatia bacterium]
MAFITVSDAAGRVLFRRRATDAEMAEAVHAADEADAGAQAAMQEIATQRYEALATGTMIEQELAPPEEVTAELEEFEQFAHESEPESERLSAEAEPQEAGLFGEDEMREDSWFGDARFTSEEEVAS